MAPTSLGIQNSSVCVYKFNKMRGVKKKFDLWEKTREVIQTEKKNSKQGPLERIVLA